MYLLPALNLRPHWAVKLIAQRCLAQAPILLLVAFGSFALLRIAPGDFLSELSADPQVAPATLAALRARYGLDQPFLLQFGQWLSHAVRGDLGYSLAYHTPVSTLIGERIANTVWLALAGLLLALCAALFTGVFSLRWPWLERALTVAASLLLATPSFVLALVALLWAARTGLAPLGGVSSLESAALAPSAQFADFLRHVWLPASVLALRQFPAYFLQLRASMHESLQADYILTARAKGLNETRVLGKHALKNALPALIVQVGNSLGALLSGAFIVETVMSWPGLGSLAVSALLSRDVYVLLGCLLYAALLLALGNLLADLWLQALDPRTRNQSHA